ncbi:MAG: hypothetical protein R3B96_10955 [Pirellulaceae bacterium]
MKSATSRLTFQLVLGIPSILFHHSGLVGDSAAAGLARSGVGGAPFYEARLEQD